MTLNPSNFPCYQFNFQKSQNSPHKSVSMKKFADETETSSSHIRPCSLATNNKENELTLKMFRLRSVAANTSYQKLNGRTSKHHRGVSFTITELPLNVFQPSRVKLNKK